MYFFNTSLIFTPKIMTHGGPCIFNVPIVIFGQISLFAANNNFGIGRQSSQKSWPRLLKLLGKTLEDTCE